ncbi:hypothetical protein BGZ65_006577 [Modicella reniformis]|uniref:Protein-S-isoprenylcysteine O-methyltransferase n=1 Tax=Modicella reniformis TaxID=1440133 RepID=A0A9P6LSH1_9FUNG|nr:hypothetical protein BGZ65_006577 [Modicella reniformis]
MVYAAKLVCQSVAIWSYAMSAQAPSSSKAVSEDKVLDENWLKNTGVRRFPMIVCGIGIFEASVYIFLMSKASASSFAGNVAIKQLSVLKPWHIGISILAVSGLAFRRWSYHTLDRFFTYQLTIRPGHRLIGHGPYKYIRHPSYTGTIINGACVYGLLWYEGLYEVMASFLSKGISWVLSRDVVIPNEILGVPGGVLVTAFYTYLMVKLTMSRVRKEEAMLKDHFGKEWDLFSSKRWCFFPFIY